MSNEYSYDVKGKICVRDMTLCAMFVVLISVGAFIKIPIPVVPFTLQVFFTTLAALLLGPKFGTISVLIYIALGLAGVPVFANGGGLSYIFSPTFGYLIGFAVGAFVTGNIAYSKKIEFKNLFLAGLCGLVFVYGIGMVYYYSISNIMLEGVDIRFVIVYCGLITLPGDIFCCALASSVAKRLIPIINKDKLIFKD